MNKKNQHISTALGIALGILVAWMLFQLSL